MSELMKVRRSRGFSQRGLAERAGVSPSSIYELENRRRKANPSTLRKLADALGVEVVDLLEVEERPKVPRPLSAEWALKVPRETLSREVEQADTDRLHKLLSELVGDQYTRTNEDHKARSEDPDWLSRRNEAFSRAYDVWEELRRRGEEAPEKGLPAFRKYLEALGYV